MAHTLDIQQKAESGGRDPACQGLGGSAAQEAERPIEPFVAELRRMTAEERIRASRYSMNRRERWAYARRYPEEAPTVNGELEWIALTLE